MLNLIPAPKVLEEREGILNKKTVRIQGEISDARVKKHLKSFRSKRFNICCDETFDPENGRHKSKDTGRLYVDFVKKLAEYLQAHGKSVAQK